MCSLKPENILLASYDADAIWDTSKVTILLGDFGLAMRSEDKNHTGKLMWYAG